MNPYASYLGDRDPAAVISATTEKIAALMEKMGTDGIERTPAPGKWSAREIVCHLADCELVFAFRLRQALAETNHVIQPFDQDQWAKSYASYPAALALEVFASTRKWNLALLKSIPSDTLSKKLTHPERGEMTYQVLIETMGGHDLNHLAQLDRLAGS